METQVEMMILGAIAADTAVTIGIVRSEAGVFRESVSGTGPEGRYSGGGNAEGVDL